MTASFRLALVLLALVPLSCSDDEESMVCDPGATQPCACPGGATGAQECAEDGMSWGVCYGCPALDGGPGVDGAQVADGTPPDGPGGCTTAADLLDPAACGAGKACSIVASDGKLGCATPGTTAFFQPCADQSACVAGSGCFGASATSLTCLPFCDHGGDDTCPTGSACTATFQTVAGVIGLCMPSASCDIVSGTGCSGNLGCYVGDSSGNPVCVAPGATTEGGSCAVSNDCLPGLVCSKSVCRKLCHDSTVCTSPATCKGVGIVFSAAPTVGICMD
jgi:hypothetical protein